MKQLKKSIKVIGLLIILLLSISSVTVYASQIFLNEKDNIQTHVTDPASLPTIDYGWRNTNKKWSYTDFDGKVYSGGLFTIKGGTYLFDKNGYLLTGFRKVNGKVYYFTDKHSNPDDGYGKLEKYTGWKKISSDIYYFRSDNSCMTGFGKISKNTFMFSKTGKLFTGWKKINKNKYYFISKGKVGVKGKMVKGIKKIKKFRYFFNSAGELQKGIVGNKRRGFYYADKKGRINSKNRKAVIYKGKKWNVLNGKATKVKTKKHLTLFRALKLVEKVTKKKMSKAAKLKACFKYVKKSYIEKNPRIPHYHGKGWCEIYANDMFVHKTGNCFSYASAFAYMAKAIGYKKVYCCNSGGHGWAEINGLVYDPEWSIHHLDNSFYALSYNTKTSNGYKGAISAGYSWMRVKI